VTYFRDALSNERHLVVARSFESIEIERVKECNNNMIAIVKQWSLVRKMVLRLLMNMVLMYLCSSCSLALEDDWRET
jgi:hypothetical protein